MVVMPVASSGATRYFNLSYILDNRWRAPATASYTGATCAALVQLVRHLHAATQWHTPITTLLLDKLQLAAQMVSITLNLPKLKPQGDAANRKHTNFLGGIAEFHETMINCLTLP